MRSAKSPAQAANAAQFRADTRFRSTISGTLFLANKKRKSTCLLALCATVFVVVWSLPAVTLFAEVYPPAEVLRPAKIDVRAIYDDFDGVQPSWRVEESSSLGAIGRHKRSDEAPYRGRRSEQISVIGLRGGEAILATHDVPASAVIEELRIRVALRGNRTGFQAMARVRLPRTLDEEGQAVSFHVLGDTYVTPSMWQELIVDKLEEKVEDAVRAKRIQLGRHVDPTGAYVDQVAINLFGGAGLNTVWLDDLSLEGTVSVTPSAQAERPTLHLAARDLPLLSHTRPDANKLPWVPRVATYNGESFAILKQLGFNTVWLKQLPSEELRKQAQEQRLWLICPPPTSSEGNGVDERVIAWHLDPKAQSLATIHRTVQWLRSHDKLNRPIIGFTEGQRTSEEWSQNVNIRIDRGVQQPTAAAPAETSKWLLVESPLVATSRWLPVRAQLWKGIAAGYGGFVVHTTQNLELPSSRNTRSLVELLNLELSIFRPWTARPHIERFSNQNDDSPFDVTVLTNSHSSLAFVQQRQNFRTIHNRSEIEIPTSHHRKVFRLEPGGLSPVPDRRVAGGIRVSLNPAKPDGVLLLTDRSAIVKDVNRHLLDMGVRTNQLMIEVLRAELVGLDERLQHAVADRRRQSYLRQEVHALHGRIAPLLEPDAVETVTFRELDHVLGQLERVHQSISR